MNQQNAFLIPKPGLIVRDPATQEPLPAEGGEKPLTQYWLRRLRDGDVRIGPAPKKNRTDKASREG